MEFRMKRKMVRLEGEILEKMKLQFCARDRL